MMQGCHLPPHPMEPPLACRPLPPVEWGLWSFWLAPPRLWGAVCSTEVWYGCCRLLVVMSSLHALSPPPAVGWGLWSFWLARPGCVGQCVLQRYGMLAAACSQSCHRYVLVTIQKKMLLFSPCKRCHCPCSDAVLRSCEEALAGIILHRPPSLWFVWTAGSRGGPGAGGPGPGGGEGLFRRAVTVQWQRRASRCRASQRAELKGRSGHTERQPLATKPTGFPLKVTPLFPLWVHTCCMKGSYRV